MEVEFKNPYEFDESLRRDDPPAGWCNGFHQTRMVKSEGPLWIEICLDPKCAEIAVCKCEHQIIVEGLDKLAPTKPINTWNEDGTILTCQYCGADVT